jgi:hypothetical protein
VRGPAHEPGTVGQAEIGGHHHLDRTSRRSALEWLYEQLPPARLGGGVHQTGFEKGDGLQAGCAGDRKPPRVGDRFRCREAHAQAGEGPGADAYRDRLDSIQVAERGRQHVARPRGRLDELLAQDPVFVEERAGGGRRGSIEREDPHSNHFRMASLRNA